MVMLSIKDLDVFYKAFKALHHIALHVQKGQIVSILGSNGAGKSTLLKTVTGLLKPRAGSIYFEEERIDRLEPHDIVDLGIALVPEGRKIFPTLTVRENLLMGSYASRARRTSRKHLEDVFMLFPVLKARMHQRGTDLSGGEQQMMAIGRALMSHPRFIIFDEISLGLSPLVVKELYKAVRKINQEGLTVVLVEQDVKRSLKVAEFAYIMQEGKITLEGKPRHFSEETIRKAYFGI